MTDAHNNNIAHKDKQIKIYFFKCEHTISYDNKKGPMVMFVNHEITVSRFSRIFLISLCISMVYQLAVA